MSFVLETSIVEWFHRSEDSSVGKDTDGNKL